MVEQNWPHKEQKYNLRHTAPKNIAVTTNNYTNTWIEIKSSRIFTASTSKQHDAHHFRRDSWTLTKRTRRVVPQNSMRQKPRSPSSSRLLLEVEKPWLFSLSKLSPLDAIEKVWVSSRAFLLDTNFLKESTIVTIDLDNRGNAEGKEQPETKKSKYIQTFYFMKVRWRSAEHMNLQGSSWRPREASWSSTKSLRTRGHVFVAASNGPCKFPTKLSLWWHHPFFLERSWSQGSWWAPQKSSPKSLRNTWDVFSGNPGLMNICRVKSRTRWEWKSVQKGMPKASASVFLSKIRCLSFTNLSWSRVRLSWVQAITSHTQICSHLIINILKSFSMKEHTPARKTEDPTYVYVKPTKTEYRKS